MKFMVMCSLVPVGDATLDPQIVERLAGMGLLAVESSRTEQGLQFGLDRTFVGEFRAHEARILQSMLREQISGLLGAAGSSSEFRLCVLPTRLPVPVRKRA